MALARPFRFGDHHNLRAGRLIAPFVGQRQAGAFAHHLQNHSVVRHFMELNYTLSAVDGFGQFLEHPP